MSWLDSIAREDSRSLLRDRGEVIQTIQFFSGQIVGVHAEAGGVFGGVVLFVALEGFFFECAEEVAGAEVGVGTAEN